MAEKLGIQQPAISKLENGDRRLTLETLSDIITALGGEWEINVKLPGSEMVRLTGSEEFPLSKFHSRTPLNAKPTSTSTKKATKRSLRKKGQKKAKV
jgi:transcriptional regulator with XRE-family HTH domain